MEPESIRECNILIIEERNELLNTLRHKGCKKAVACKFDQIVSLLEDKEFNVVLLDTETPSVDILQLVQKVHDASVETAIILITPDPQDTKVIEALRKGAYAYILKPVNIEELEVIGRKAIERQILIRANRELQQRLREKYKFSNILGISKGMQIVYETISKVAKTNASVLIQGESGTGKALVARAIHYNSPRRKASFVEVNCASLPESLLENELFGHEKGAFTGALQLYRGRFERADGGTIFLDEVSELSLSSQAKLLRVLQEREFERLGGKSTIKVDVRVIASTNRNLEALVREGKFREDLYYRLNVVSIIMPPLRTRKEDIPIYVDHFIRVYSKDHQKSIKGISQKAMDELLSYSWPGNVRELQNVIERAVVIAEEELILPEHLPFSIQSVDYKDDTPPPIDENLSLSQNLERVEEYIIKRALLRFSGNRKLAATFLGISEKALQQKIRRYKIG